MKPIVSDTRLIASCGLYCGACRKYRLLENDTPERIEMYYQFNKQGFCELFK